MYDIELVLRYLIIIKSLVYLIHSGMKSYFWLEEAEIVSREDLDFSWLFFSFVAIPYLTGCESKTVLRRIEAVAIMWR